MTGQGIVPRGTVSRVTGWVLGHGTGLFLMVQGGIRGPGLGAERIQRSFSQEWEEKEGLFLLESLGGSE